MLSDGSPQTQLGNEIRDTFPEEYECDLVTGFVVVSHVPATIVDEAYTEACDGKHVQQDLVQICHSLVRGAIGPHFVVWKEELLRDNRRKDQAFPLLVLFEVRIFMGYQSASIGACLKL